MRAFGPILLLASLAANGCTRADPVAVVDPWIRAAPPGAPALAGYAQLRNDGDADVEVSPCTTAGFHDVALHETVHDALGVARMRPLVSLQVAAGSSVVLRPGAAHLMLMGPELVPRAGDRVPVCLRIGSEARTVLFEVRQGAAQTGGDPHHQHH